MGVQKRNQNQISNSGGRRQNDLQRGDEERNSRNGEGGEADMEPQWPMAQDRE